MFFYKKKIRFLFPLLHYFIFFASVLCLCSCCLCLLRVVIIFFVPHFSFVLCFSIVFFFSFVLALYIFGWNLSLLFLHSFCGDSYPIFPVPDTFTTVNNPLHKSTRRAGALVTSTILPGWRATRVGPGQCAQYTRAPQNGERLWVARKHHNQIIPMRTNHTRNFHMVAEHVPRSTARQGAGELRIEEVCLRVDQ